MSSIPRELASGRWVGKWWETECVGCGCMLACREPERDSTRVRCASCRAENDVAQVRVTMRDLMEERDAWMARAKKAEHQLNDACDEVATLRAQLSEQRSGAM